MQKKAWKTMAIRFLFLSFLIFFQGTTQASEITAIVGDLGEATYSLHLPASYDEKVSLPLVIVLDTDASGKVSERLAATNTKSEFSDGYVLLVLKDTPDLSPDDTIAVIAKVRSEYSIDDTMVFGVSVAGTQTLLDVIAKKYDVLFAATQELSPGQVDEFVKSMRATKRGKIYNGALKARNVYTNVLQSPSLTLAFDGSQDTVWSSSAAGEKNLVVGFPHTVVVSRYRITGPSPVRSFCIDTSEDGKEWHKAVTIENNTARKAEGILPSIAANYIRLSTNEKKLELAEFEVYAELAVSREFRAELFVSSDGFKVPYRLFVPQNYDELESLPLVVFYHGSGQRGVDNMQQLGLTKGEGAVVWALTENQLRNPCIVLAPQIPPKALWRDQDVMKANEELLSDIKRRYPKTDENRIYGTGLSIGAEGLCNMSIKNPELFAALHLVAGGPNNPVGGGPAVEETVIPNVHRFAAIPMWAMQSWDDSVRPIALTTRMIDEYRTLGYNPRYTVYLPGVTLQAANSTHASWMYAYEDPRVPEWLFAQDKRNRAVKVGKKLLPLENIDEEDISRLSSNKLYVDMDKGVLPQGK